MSKEETKGKESEVEIICPYCQKKHTVILTIDNSQLEQEINAKLRTLIEQAAQKVKQQTEEYWKRVVKDVAEQVYDMTINDMKQEPLSRISSALEELVKVKVAGQKKLYQAIDKYS